MLLIKKAKIIDPNSKHHKKTVDVLIEKGKIKQIGSNLKSDKANTFEAKNLHLSPGWFDMRTNFREPGHEHKEDLQSGLSAATNGGFTGVLLMPSTNPPIDSKADIDFIKSKTAAHPVEVFVSGSVTAGMNGTELAEMFDMAQAGAIAFSDDKQTIANPDILKRALLYNKPFGGLIIHYPNEKKVMKNGQMHEGNVSTALGLKGIPALAEELGVSRDLYVLEYTDGKLHLGPLSTTAAIEMVKSAKRKKQNVTCEIAVHNLLLSDAELETFDSNLKVSPPLRDKQHIKSLVKGIKEGTIDVISSDHCPEDEENKKREFEHAAFGISSIETAFSVANTALQNEVPLERIIETMSINPRKLLQLDIPSINEKEEANLTLFDPKITWEVQESGFNSKSKNSPFIGRKLTGKPLAIFNKNKLVKLGN